jgi:hypothetical protein
MGNSLFRSTDIANGRRDLATFQIVEAGIALMRVYGTAEAAKFLSDAGVGFAVTVRVLSELGPRRAP